MVLTRLICRCKGWSGQYSVVVVPLDKVLSRALDCRTSGISCDIAALTSTVGDRAAFKGQEIALQAGEAKSMSALNTRGVIFNPLTYVASVFSMSSPYFQVATWFGCFLRSADIAGRCPDLVLPRARVWATSGKEGLAVFGLIPANIPKILAGF